MWRLSSCGAVLILLSLLNVVEIQAQSCENPDDLLHGRYNMSQGTDSGATIIATCEEGYILNGPTHRTCLNGSWDKKAPVCADVVCERPLIPHAYKIGGKPPPYEYKNFVQYECDRGYKMIGSNYLICEENGWNPEPPECYIVTCPKLPLIDHGRYEPDKPIYEYNNKITYSCDRCYKLLGPRVKTCSQNEDFTPTYPATICTKVYCNRPQGFFNGNFQPEKKRYDCGESINFSCNIGYNLVGSKESECSENGKFTSTPTCEIVTCPRPDTNDKDLKEQYNYGEKIKFYCNPGFKLNGPASITCLENGKFDVPPSRCEVVTCPPPHALINGKFQPIKDNYFYGKKVQFYCNPGYELKGSAESQCCQNEKITTPACIKLNCPQPNIKNADVITEETDGDSFDSPVLYTCREGFKRDGPGYLSCTLNGWNPNPNEQCKEITCEAPGIINGKKLGGPIYKYNSSVEYECDEGYIMYGSNNMICKQQGWDGRLPQCNK